MQGKTIWIVIMVLIVLSVDGVNVMGFRFNDVSTNDWFYTPVVEMSQIGAIKGDDYGNYNPQSNITRADILVLGMRAFEVPIDPTATHDFADVANDEYYTTYIATGRKLGLVSGSGDNNFYPNSDVSRHDMFVMFYRILQLRNALPQGDNGRRVSDFADGYSVPEYAVEAMELFVKTGVVNGMDGVLSPLERSTRAQAAQVLCNLYSQYKESTSPTSEKQSKVPFLGAEEIEPLLAGYNTVGDFLKNAPYLPQTEYELCVEGATGNVILDVGLVDVISYARFSIEENSFINFEDGYSNGRIILEELPKEVLESKVLTIYYLDFTRLGIPYNIRGITEGSNAENVRLAFLNTNRYIKEYGQYGDMELFSQYLYKIQDVVPNAVTDDAHGGEYYIYALDRATDDPEYNHGCLRYITYSHSIPYENGDVPVYNIYGWSSDISFSIDYDGTVAALTFHQWAHEN